MSKRIAALGMATLAALILFRDVAGANGGAYNGPNMAGTSVPYLTERAITKGDLASTLEACSLEAALDISTQMIRKPLASQYVKGGSSYIESGEYKLDIVMSFNNVTDVGYENLSIIFGSEHITLYDNNNPKNLKYQTLTLTTSEKLPVFVYDSEIPDTAYDELGRPNLAQAVLKNLTLVFPKNYGDSVTLINIDTNHATSLRLNEKKLVACYVAKLQGH